MISRVAATLRSSSLFRYLLVGGAGYVFEMLVLFITFSLLQFGSTLSVSLSFWLGLVFSFFFQKVLAFQNRDHKARTLGLQTLLYAALVLLNYGFTVFFAAITAPIVGVFVARTIALLITTAWNYFLYRRIIFNTRDAA